MLIAAAAAGLAAHDIDTSPSIVSARITHIRNPFIKVHYSNFLVIQKAYPLKIGSANPVSTPIQDTDADTIFALTLRMGEAKLTYGCRFLIHEVWRIAYVADSRK